MVTSANLASRIATVPASENRLAAFLPGFLFVVAVTAQPRQAQSRRLERFDGSLQPWRQALAQFKAGYPATPVAVTLRFSESDVALDVTANWPAPISWPTVAMRERVALCGGELGSAQAGPAMSRCTQGTAATNSSKNLAALIAPA